MIEADTALSWAEAETNQVLDWLEEAFAECPLHKCHIDTSALLNQKFWLTAGEICLRLGHDVGEREVEDRLRQADLQLHILLIMDECIPRFRLKTG